MTSLYSSTYGQTIKLLTAVLFVFILFNPSYSQVDEGIRLNTEEAMDGYVLCESFSNTYLLNECGEIVNEWNLFSTNLHSKLLENGNLLYLQANMINERSWSDLPVLSISPNTTNLGLVYEVIKMENGNYLCLARRLWTDQQFNEIGWDFTLGTPDRMDGVVEINPQGEIVWEWSLGDHTVQNVDSSLSNFGDPAENPQLVDPNRVGTFDWTFEESFMINGMDYNPELDQIALSVRKMSEVMIIDHSTTTKEAKGSTGGRYGKGGDILYRWGNPQNYGQGTAADRVLFYQHNPNWIQYGPLKGQIMIFNNGLNRPNIPFGEQYSSSVTIAPPNNDGNYFLEDGEYGPEVPTLVIDRINTDTDFYSGYTSASKVLPNGNIFITEGRFARFMEVDSEGKLLWEYILPGAAYIFRSEKYPSDYPAFEGKDLEGYAVVENPPSNYQCEIISSTNAIASSIFEISHFMSSEKLIIETENQSQYDIFIHDITGQRIYSNSGNSGRRQISTQDYSPGSYVITVLDQRSDQSHSQQFVIVR